MNIFTNAKVIKAPKANAKPARNEFKIEGIEEFSAVDSILKNLTTVKETLEVTLKETVVSKFLELAAKLGRRPENFVGKEGQGSASCELRKRSSRSPLKDEEKEVLKQYKIPYGEVEVTTETFIINPEYINNKEMMTKVSKALEKIGLPSDFIMFQEGVKTHVVEDESLDAAFKLKVDELAEVLPILTIVGLKPKLETKNMGEVMKTVHKSLGIVEAIEDSKVVSEPKGEEVIIPATPSKRRKLVVG